MALYSQKIVRLASKGDFRPKYQGAKGLAEKKKQELTQLLSGVVFAEITPKILPDTSVVLLHINTIVCYDKW